MSQINCDSYQIYIDEPWSILDEWIINAGFSNVFVLVDQNTKDHCLPLFEEKLSFDFQIIEIEAGELNKNLDSCHQVWSALLEKQADRNSLLVNLGGGMVGDLGGFAASTFMRGMKFLQIPTSLLSMVDASVGGKTGIDFKTKKNLIGLFQTPQMVWINSDFLKTLPFRELKSGYAEVIKHALIHDRSRWDELVPAKDLISCNWESLINWNVTFKQSVVEMDFEESGRRKILNFGHTIGHAIESAFLCSENPLLHGEAIAIGMIIESQLSQELLGLSQKDTEEIQTYITAFYNINLSLLESKQQEILKNIDVDKKNTSGIWMCTLIDQIGSAVFNQAITKNQVSKYLFD